MITEWTVLFSSIIAMYAESASPTSCFELAQATAIAHGLSDLPREIRADLLTTTHNEIRDVDVPLLNTDAPTERERSYATLRFVQAARFERFWLVQIEEAMVAGVRTISYIRRDQGPRESGPFVRTNWHVFAGPACASIRATLEGVTTPGGF
jgi:hypothetical protein